MRQPPLSADVGAPCCASVNCNPVRIARACASAAGSSSLPMALRRSPISDARAADVASSASSSVSAVSSRSSRARL